MQKRISGNSGHVKSIGSNSKILLKSRKIKSGIKTDSKPDSIFRSDFLKHNLTAKSGYVSYNKENKQEKALSWLRALKNHKEYKSIEIHETASINDTLTLLHKETSRLFKGFDWIVRFEDYETSIYYYQSLGDIGQHNLPIDWINNHENKAFRELALTIIGLIAKSFRIDIIRNHIFDLVIEPGLTKGKFNAKQLKAHLIDCSGYEEEEELQPMIEQIKSYLVGNISELKKEIEAKTILNQFKSLLKKIPSEKSEWLSEAIELLKNPCDINDFDFTPFDVDRYDGDPVTIQQAIFFPYSFTDKVFEQYEQWLNDLATTTGVNDIFQYGILTKERHLAPANKEPLFKLMNWIDKGREIYFKETENDTRN